MREPAQKQHGIEVSVLKINPQ